MLLRRTEESLGMADGRLLAAGGDHGHEVAAAGEGVGHGPQAACPVAVVVGEKYFHSPVSGSLFLVKDNKLNRTTDEHR